MAIRRRSESSIRSRLHLSHQQVLQCRRIQLKESPRGLCRPGHNRAARCFGVRQSPTQCRSVPPVPIQRAEEGWVGDQLDLARTAPRVFASQPQLSASAWPERPGSPREVHLPQPTSFLRPNRPLQIASGKGHRLSSRILLLQRTMSSSGWSQMIPPPPRVAARPVGGQSALPAAGDGRSTCVNGTGFSLLSRFHVPATTRSHCFVEASCRHARG